MTDTKATLPEVQELPAGFDLPGEKSSAVATQRPGAYGAGSLLAGDAGDDVAPRVSPADRRITVFSKR